MITEEERDKAVEALESLERPDDILVRDATPVSLPLLGLSEDLKA